MGTTLRSFMKAVYGLYGAALVLATAPAHATIPLADSPLFLTVAVPPNITLTLDDSGSMARAFVPDTCGAFGNDCSTLDNRYAKSAHFNPLYYNPNITYSAPKKADGTELTTSFTDAHRNGFDPGGTLGARNLETSYRPTAYLDLPPGGPAAEGYMGHFSNDVRCSSANRCEISSGSGWAAGPQSCSSSSDCRGSTPSRVPAYYYVFDDGNSGCGGTDAQKAVDNDCYDIKVVTTTSGPGNTDETQNFANWYSFARTRNLATQTAASLAFAELDSEARVAWQALHTCRNSSTNFVDTDCDGWKNDFTGVSNQIRPFADTATVAHKSNFYSWLSQLPTNASTPLPAAMQRVGEYYRRSGEGNPYDIDLEASGSGELACRRNYHVLMTDGIWNDAISVPGGNKDGTTIALPESQDGISQYAPISPYTDAHSNTLADLAFHYWVTDLRGTLDNNLLRNYRDSTGTAAENFWNPRNDPASWQHMVNFTIGLGLSGYLAQAGLTWDGSMYGGSYSGLLAGTTAWPAPGANSAANVADLWHAAINSRGQFFSADDPASLSVAFRAALTAITEASGSSAALSANSTSLTGATLVYQAKFNDDWSGALLALPVTTGGAVGTEVWDASELIPAHGARRIFTHNGSSGVEFSSCTNLSAAQQAALNSNSGGVVDNLCEARLAWLRGNPKDEVRSTTAASLNIFRNRPNTVMGDIINSDPAYVKDVDYGYSGLPAGTPGQSSYDSYRVANAGRMPMVYVGANDGRVYGIRGDFGAADSGVEQFSYIPGGVYPNLSHLTDPSYTHRYYVDGSITVGDAYLGGAWKSILLGGLNAGGKTIYALDVTNPDSFDASKVMWEFDAGDGGADVGDDAADLGQTYSRPQIGILESGQWVAVFGNGYNSADGGAHLYIIDLETGALIRKIVATDAAGDDNNGLSTPVLFDSDDNKLFDTAYAGDLQGNLWKFDLSDAAAASWEVANNQPLFRARIGATAQPITAQPKVAGHSFGGSLILFGTGRYLTNADVFDTSRQTFYGIWDNDSATTAERADLQVQTFDVQTAKFGRTVRSVTDNSVDWAGGKRGWYLDLLDGVGPTAAEIGERVVHTSLVKAGRVIFGSIVPSTDPCKPGGSSWLIELKLGTGGAFTNSVLDLNNDGLFDQSDTAEDEVVNAVSNDTLGISNVPVWIEDPDEDLAYKVRTGTTGNFATEKNCLEENEALCAAGPPTTTPGVARRSWIQIR